MAIFEDTEGNAQVVSTSQGAVSHVYAEGSRGSSESYSHLKVGGSFAHSEGHDASHSKTLQSNASVGRGEGLGESFSGGHTSSIGRSWAVGDRESQSSGLSHHVSQSLEQHLTQHGYTAEGARQSVSGVSDSLGQAISNHAMGSGGAVEFHKSGDVAVSMSSGKAESSADTVAVSMDELKRVHESGMTQSLSSGHQMSRSDSVGNQASASQSMTNEMSMSR